MSKTSQILKAFADIGVPPHELRLLAHTVDFDKAEINEDAAIPLRDAWSRCKRGEPRVEAFSAFIDPTKTLKDFL